MTLRTAPVRQSSIGSTGPRGEGRPSMNSVAQSVRQRWLGLVMLAGLGAPWGVVTRRAPAWGLNGRDRDGSRGASTQSPHVARFVPKDQLVAYLEFSGLDAHAAAWKKTAAYRVLTETPL